HDDALGLPQIVSADHPLFFGVAFLQEFGDLPLNLTAFGAASRFNVELDSELVYDSRLQSGEVVLIGARTFRAELIDETTHDAVDDVGNSLFLVITFEQLPPHA